MAEQKTAAKGAKAKPAKTAALKVETKAAAKTAAPAKAKPVAETPKPAAASAKPVVKPAAPAKASAPKAETRKLETPKVAAPKAAAPTVENRKLEVPKAAAGTVKAAAEATNKINERTIEMQNETTQIINDRAQAVFGDINERAKQTVERSSRMVEEMTDLTRGNVEAIVASSKVAARGLETLGQEVAEFSRRSFEEASAAVKNLAEVRSAPDFFRLQTEFARTAFDSIVAESSKMSEAMIKLAGEVAEPITSRYSVAAERVKNIAA